MNSSEAGVLGTIVAIMAIIVLGNCGSPLAGGDVLIGYGREVTGEVVKTPKSRYVRGENSGQEKVSITVRMDNPDPSLPGYANGNVMLECASTRCQQIEKGETHVFACRIGGRFFEPNVLECKHVTEM